MVVKVGVVHDHLRGVCAAVVAKEDRPRGRLELQDEESLASADTRALRSHHSS